MLLSPMQNELTDTRTKNNTSSFQTPDAPDSEELEVTEE